MRPKVPPASRRHLILIGTILLAIAINLAPAILAGMELVVANDGAATTLHRRS